MLLTGCGEDEPQTAADAAQKGCEFLSNGDFDSAISAYTDAITLDPGCARAYLGRADAYARSGDLGRAIADYSQAIQCDPRNASA